MCDNVAVVSAYNGLGCRDPALMRGIKRIYSLCRKYNIILTIEWIETALQLADAPSREMSLTECKLRSPWPEMLCKYIGVSIDLFAGSWNTISPRYYSLHYDPEAVGMNGLSYKYELGDVPYIYCPRKLTLAVLHGIVAHCDQAVMVGVEYSTATIAEQEFNKYFDSRIIIGNLASKYSRLVIVSGDRNRPAVLRPVEKRRMGGSDCSPYYRPYRELSRTYLYFRNIDDRKIRLFVNHFRAEVETSWNAESETKGDEYGYCYHERIGSKHSRRGGQY